MTQVVIDPATHAAIQAVKADVAEISKGIKSVQRGMSGAGSITISAINPAKSVVYLIGFPLDGSGVGAAAKAAVTISDSTHISVTCWSSLKVGWQVVEYY